MWEKIKQPDSWLTFLLVWAMVILVAAAVGAANLVITLDMQPILLWTATLGVVTGFALAKSRFPALTAAIYATVYGTFVAGFLIGRTLPEEMVWRERVSELVLRQVEFFTKIAQGNTNRDALIFVVHTTIVLWVLGVTAAWWTYRRPRPWHVILPSALTMLSVIYYASPQLTIYLAVFCLVALLYIAQTHLIDNKKVWQRARVTYNHSISGNFIRSSLVVALLALAMVWQAPALPANAAVGDAINRVNRPWRTVRDNWQRLYSALNAQAVGTSDPYRDTLTLGGARNPTDAPIMDVFVEERLPYAYWRSTTLDSYNPDSGQWQVASGETVTLYPDEPPINVPESRGRKNVTQTFVNYIPNAGTIYGAPDIVSADRQINYKTAYDSEGNALVSATRSRYLLELNDRYEVTSRLSVADQTSLRNASTDYPAYIEEIYLDVPDEISQRVRDLAADLAAPYDNPYDQALAIQNYLRNVITYNDQVDAPPPDVEAIDYFLFETREGYCNYYASAFAMMLRTLDVPTRLSRGFAAGEFNEDNSLYRVRARDAHVWPEVYFSEYGWIQFEPTVILDPISRPVGEDDDFPIPLPQRDTPLLEDDAPFEESSMEEMLDEFGSGEEETAEAPSGFLATVNWVRALGTTTVLAVAGTLIVVANRSNKRTERSVDGSYGRLEMWGRWMQLPMANSQTPAERSSLFQSAIPESGSSVERLIRAFERKQFGPKKVKRAFNLDTLKEWKVLRPLFFKRGLRSRMTLRRRKKSDSEE